MRLLLDTHVLLWALRAPDRLSREARASISDPRNELVVSAISAFEIATKHRLGKLPDAATLLFAYPEYIRELGANECPISGAEALMAGQLPWDHRDPFDRIFAAQALRQNVTLVTADKVFESLGGIRLLW